MQNFISFFIKCFITLETIQGTNSVNDFFKVPLKTAVKSMGVRRLFSRGGQNFPGGGAKTYYLPKKHLNILFSSKKVKKHTILAGQGGQGPPLALPCGRP